MAYLRTSSSSPSDTPADAAALSARVDLEAWMGRMKLAAEGAMLILNLGYKVSGVSKNRVALAPVIRHARAICGEPTYPHLDG